MIQIVNFFSKSNVRVQLRHLSHIMILKVHAETSVQFALWNSTGLQNHFTSLLKNVKSRV